jgi:hypothetical protein
VAAWRAASPAGEAEQPTRTALAPAAPRRKRRSPLLAAAAAVAAAGAAAIAVRQALSAPAAVTAGAGAAVTSPAPAPAPPPAAPPAAEVVPVVAAAHPLPDQLPGAGGEEAADDGAAGRRPIEAVHGLNALPVPPRASGDGILSVNAIPWGTVKVDGHAVGDTPQEMRLPAGRHRIRIERKGHRTVDEVVTVRAGARTKLLR